jgi:hypothetical protein
MEEIMSLLGDLLKTVGDAMRLSSDVIRYQMETKKRAVKRGISRIVICIAMGLIALGFVGGGMGLLLYGAYLMVAHELGRGPSGLIIGAASILFAGLLMLLACRTGGRS